jgi:thiamine-monophosphate kinase
LAVTLSEFGLIAKYFAPLARDPAALMLSDDACVLKPEPGRELIVTADALVEGVHFLASDPPDLIASKALRVNLSDLAAKGAEPRGYLLALALPPTTTDAWLQGFARGLSADQDRFGTSLLGGDTTSTPGSLTIAVTALGTAPAGAMIRRRGARPGDGVYVSGTIGDAGAGLQLLQAALEAGEGADFLIGRYRQPTPRLALGKALRGVATASLDVSDGLIADLGHIADVSAVRLVVDANRIPLSGELLHFWPGPEGLLRAATAGDDYEIAFTAASDESVAAAAAKADVSVTRIGRVETGSGVILLDGSGQAVTVARPGFLHF